MSERVSANLKRIIEASDLSDNKLQKLTGISDATIHNSASSKTASIPFDAIDKLAAALGVSILEIVGEVDNLVPPGEQRKRVPVYERIAAGDPAQSEAYLVGYAYVDDNQIVCGYQIKGDSMTPTIPAGAVVYITQNAEISNGDIVVAYLIEGDGNVVKRWYRDDQERRIVLKSDNPAYEPHGYQEDQLHIIGKVVMFTAKI
jgi:SOS-response transcriptional repressor LexA